MDSHEIAVTAVAFLTPYLLKAGEEAAQKAGGAAWEKVTEIYQAVTERFKKKKDAETLKKYELSPKEHEAAMQTRLEEKLAKDTAFRGQLTQLLSEAVQANAQGMFNIRISESQIRNLISAVIIKGGIHINN